MYQIIQLENRPQERLQGVLLSTSLVLGALRAWKEPHLELLGNSPEPGWHSTREGRNSVTWRKGPQRCYPVQIRSLNMLTRYVCQTDASAKKARHSKYENYCVFISVLFWHINFLLISSVWLQIPKFCH